jgi:hypothetical protein
VQTKVTVWPVQMLPLSYLTSFVSTVSVRARMAACISLQHVTLTDLQYIILSYLYSIP